MLFPAENGLFRWTVSPPFGKELIKVIASKQPLGRLSAAQLRQLRFNPVSEKDIDSTRAELAGKKAAWTEDQVEINTYARGKVPAPAGGRRFAVFSGVGHYEFNSLLVEAEKASLKKANKWKEGDPDPDGLDLGNSPTNNAKLLETLFRRYGQLTDSQRRINEQATRQGLKESIEWLTKVSRPGDTVFIYHAGHGGRIPNDPQDDGKLPPGVKPMYFLLPHDFADLDVFAALAAKNKSGGLDPSLKSRFEKMRDIVFQDDRDLKSEQDFMAAEMR